MHTTRDVPVVVRRKMRAGEEIVWIESPILEKFANKESGGVPGAIFGAILIAISVPVAVAAIWKWSAILAILTVIFAGIGYFSLTAPRSARRKALETIYVISNQRLLVFKGQSFTSFSLRDVGAIKVEFDRDDNGNVILAQKRWQDADGDWQSLDFGFTSISKVSDVGELISQLKEKATTTIAPSQ